MPEINASQKNCRILIIMGPTASGKSALALEAARRYNGEIVSADSMQFYRELSIGVAKPSAAEKLEIPHHLIDCCSIFDRVDVWFFLNRAHNAIKEIGQRGKLPIICGGSGMYIKALQYGLDDLPGDRELRAQLDAQYDNAAALPELLARTCREDPLAYEKYSTNQRKMIRALEVRLLTGESIVTLQQNKMLHPAYNALSLALTPKREYLRDRIAGRTLEMLNSGWVKEAERVLKVGLLATPTARQAIGYNLIGEYLDGRLNFEQLRERIVTATWQFARRQLTWFRHQHPEALPLEYQDKLSWGEVEKQLH